MLKRLTLLVPLAVMAGAFLFPAVARAEPAPSRERAAAAPREEILARVRTLLDDEAVGGRLEAMGLDREELESRLDRLDDAQLQQLAGRLDAAAVGRDAVGFVIVLLILAALVLLVIFLAERV